MLIFFHLVFRSIFRKAKGAREARKETLTLELNANVS
jgi:hypothetical protein